MRQFGKRVVFFLAALLLSCSACGNGNQSSGSSEAGTGKIPLNGTPVKWDQFPMPAAASLADVGFFRRLDGGASAIWALGAAYRAGLMLFSIRAVYAQVRGGKGAQVAARDGA